MKKELTIQTAPNPLSLLEMAVTKGTDISQLKELMDLQERWEKKEAKKMFFEALSQFQNTVPIIKKAKTAKITSAKGFFSYKFADLGTIAQCIKKPMNECGLSYRWEFEEGNNKLKCSCHVSHKGGHTETTVMESVKDNSGAKNEIQQTGSTQTYLQRYTLIGALGLSTAEEDTDGKQGDKGLSEDEVLQQWQDLVDQAKTRLELTNIFLKNKKAIESNPKIQAMMKTKEASLKASETPHAKVNMP
jgi:hypothetical protein